MTNNELIKAWDANEEIKTIEMGGMGMIYEQSVQLAAFETVRECLDKVPPFEKIEDAVRSVSIKYGLHLSGEQGSCAMELAYKILFLGYDAMVKTIPADRRTSTCKELPRLVVRDE